MRKRAFELQVQTPTVQPLPNHEFMTQAISRARGWRSTLLNLDDRPANCFVTSDLAAFSCKQHASSSRQSTTPPDHQNINRCPRSWTSLTISSHFESRKPVIRQHSPSSYLVPRVPFSPMYEQLSRITLAPESSTDWLAKRLPSSFRGVPDLPFVMERAVLFPELGCRDVSQHLRHPSLSS